MYFIRHFLDLFDDFAADAAKFLVYSMQWPGTTDDPTHVQKLVASKDWTMDFETQPSAITGSDPQYMFQVRQTTQEAAELALGLVTGANPLLWPHRTSLLSYANEILKQYEALGITHFHAGFALITKRSA